MSSSHSFPRSKPTQKLGVDTRGGAFAMVLPVLLVGLIGFVALAAGGLVAVGGQYVVAFVSALALALLAILLPVRIFFFVFVVVLFLIGPQLQYFARIEKAFWIPFGLALMLFMRVGMHVMTMPRRCSSVATPSSTVSSSIFWLYGIFLLTAVASSIINAVSPIQFLVFGKEYFFFGVVLWMFSSRAVGVAELEQLVRWIPWFLALQIPAVVYQRFVVAAKRIGGSPWDAVVGLFGGDPLAGGASGTMGLFSLIATVLVVEAWKAGKASCARAAVTFLLGFAAVALAEVKVVIFLLPIVALFEFGSSITRRPLLGLLGLSIGVAASIVLMMVYQSQFVSNRMAEGSSLEAYAKGIFERNLDERVASFGGGDMGRVEALRLWTQERQWENVTQTIVGHGVGSARFGGFSLGEIPKRYQIRVARSSLAVHLWEVGLLGTVALLGALISGILICRRLARLPANRDRSWLFRAFGLSLLLMLLLLPYGPDFVDVAQHQVLALMMLGAIHATARGAATK